VFFCKKKQIYELTELWSKGTIMVNRKMEEGRCKKKPLSDGAERLYYNESYINSMSFIVDLVMCHHQQEATHKDGLGSNLSLLIKETGHSL